MSEQQVPKKHAPDEPRSNGGATRRNALDRLASLSAQTSGQDADSGDFHELCKLGASKSRDASRGSAGAVAIPMSTRELEVLLALAGELVDDGQQRRDVALRVF